MKLTTIFFLLLSCLIFFTSITLANDNNNEKPKKPPNRYNLLIKSKNNLQARHQGFFKTNRHPLTSN